VKDHNAGGDACAKKEVRRKSDDSFKKVLFNKLFPDFSLTASAEQGAMRQDYTHPSNVFIGGFDHVGDEGIVAFTFWRHAPVKTVELVGRGVVCAPLVEGEGGIGDHDVEFHELIPFQEFGTVQRVAPFDGCVVHFVQEHVHPCQRPGASVDFLSVEGKVIAADLFGGLDKK